MNYLSKRNGSNNWYYRESYPPDILELLARTKGRAPKGEKWTSLGTPDLRIAKGKLPSMRADQHREWADMRKAAAPVGIVPASAEMAAAVADFVHEKFVEQHRAKLRAALQAGIDLSTEANERRKRMVQVELDPTPLDAANMERVATALCRQQGWDLGPGADIRGERWIELLSMVDKAMQLARGRIVNTLDGRAQSSDRDAVLQHIGGGKRRDKAKLGESLLELFDLYKADCLRDGKSADTLDAEQKVIGHFASFVGQDRSVTDIDRPDIRDFRRVLSRVPHRWLTRPELKGMSIADAASHWERIGGQGRAMRTVARELSGVSSFFEWLIGNDYFDRENPTIGYIPRFEKRKTKYPPYTQGQLEAVFGSPLFVSCDPNKPHLPGTVLVRDWRYWLPLCALYSGARAGELAQLLCADVRQEQGVWVFDFNEEGSDDKSLKNDYSWRIVPIHSALFRLGFGEYLAKTRDAGHAQLFPEIQQGPRGDWSYRPSKFWQKYLKNIGVKERGLALHSFRHGFVDECRRRGTPKEVVQALMGHSDGSMTGHYGSIPWGPLMERKAAIEALSYGGLHMPVHDAVEGQAQAA